MDMRLFSAVFGFVLLLLLKQQFVFTTALILLEMTRRRRRRAEEQQRECNALLLRRCITLLPPPPPPPPPPKTRDPRLHPSSPAGCRMRSKNKTDSNRVEVYTWKRFSFDRVVKRSRPPLCTRLEFKPDWA